MKNVFQGKFLLLLMTFVMGAAMGQGLGVGGAKFVAQVEKMTESVNGGQFV